MKMIAYPLLCVLTASLSCWPSSAEALRSAQAGAPTKQCHPGYGVSGTFDNGSWVEVRDSNTEGQLAGVIGLSPVWWESYGEAFSVPLPAEFSSGVSEAISDSGFIIGTAENYPEQKAFLYEIGVANSTIIHPPESQQIALFGTSYPNSRAVAMTNSGLVLMWLGDLGPEQIVLREPNTELSKIELPPGVDYAFPNDMNESGIVAGYFFDSLSNIRPFIWSVDIGFIEVTDPDTHLNEAVMIFDDGTVVIGGHDQHGRPGYYAWSTSTPMARRLRNLEGGELLFKTSLAQTIIVENEIANEDERYSIYNNGQRFLINDLLAPGTPPSDFYQEIDVNGNLYATVEDLSGPTHLFDLRRYHFGYQCR